MSLRQARIDFCCANIASEHHDTHDLKLEIRHFFKTRVTNVRENAHRLKRKCERATGGRNAAEQSSIEEGPPIVISEDVQRRVAKDDLHVTRIARRRKTV
jgi:hypothetical protein